MTKAINVAAPKQDALSEVPFNLGIDFEFVLIDVWTRATHVSLLTSARHLQYFAQG